jgi:hypothetical protein
VVTAASGEPVGTVLRGFTLTGGTGQASSPGSVTGGGGIFVGEASQLDVRECVITGNSAEGYGGGVVAIGPSATVTITDCTLSNNSSMSGLGAAVGTEPVAFYFLYGSAVSMKGCIVTRNFAGPTGAAIHLVNGSGTIEDCSITDNEGNGMYRIGYGHTVKACVFKGNTGWGYFHNAISGGDVSDCQFLGNGLGGAELDGGWTGITGNIAQRCVFAGGDVLQMFAGYPAIESCTFDGAHAECGAVTIHNCIFRNTTSIVVGPSASVSYSNVAGGAPGVGNIDADPLWMDVTAGDYRLSPGSPCINTGDPASGVDPDSSPADMGALAYEPWTDLGGGVAGGAGLPVLVGQGPLIAGQNVALELSGMPSATFATLIVGGGQLGAAFKGGVFWPTVNLVLPGLFLTDGTGHASVTSIWPSSLPSALSFWVQVWFADAGAPQGFAGSNGVRGTTP